MKLNIGTLELAQLNRGVPQGSVLVTITTYTIYMPPSDDSQLNLAFVNTSKDITAITAVQNCVTTIYQFAKLQTALISSNKMRRKPKLGLGASCDVVSLIDKELPLKSSMVQWGPPI